VGVLTSNFAIILEIQNGGFKGRTLNFIVGEAKGWVNRDLSPAH
jgi:hypothetical protein